MQEFSLNSEIMSSNLHNKKSGSIFVLDLQIVCAVLKSLILSQTAVSYSSEFSSTQK